MAKVLEIIGDGGCEAVIGDYRLSAHRICFRLATPMEITTPMPKIAQLVEGKPIKNRKNIKASQLPLNEIREALSTGRGAAEILRELKNNGLVRTDYRLSSFCGLIDRHGLK